MPSEFQNHSPSTSFTTSPSIPRPEPEDEELDALDDERARARQLRRSRSQMQNRRLVIEGRSGRRVVEEPDSARPQFCDPEVDARFPGPDLADRVSARSVTEARATAQHFEHYSSYDAATHGPGPTPDWVVTSLAAVDTNLGIVKTGKEADVHLIERSIPGTKSCLLAVKTYRSADHRMFHRDSGYTEGRRTRRSREARAMDTRTAFGKELLAGKWAGAEFAALSRLWLAGVPVPYPVQLIGSELMMEFIGGEDGVAAPRLANFTPGRNEDSSAIFAGLWNDLVSALEQLAGMGLSHGDLSPYNVLVDTVDGAHRCVLIDLPQVVDVIANPQGRMYLARDAAVISEFFRRRGVGRANSEVLTLQLTTEAGLGTGVT